jgi:hypothetical protein
MHQVLDNEALSRLGKMAEALSLQELHALNRIVVHRIKLFHKAGKFVALSKFAVGERIKFFANDGSIVHGHIIRLNQKTASILSEDGIRWTVSPELLNKV